MCTHAAVCGTAVTGVRRAWLSANCERWWGYAFNAEETGRGVREARKRWCLHEKGKLVG